MIKLLLFSIITFLSFITIRISSNRVPNSPFPICSKGLNSSSLLYVYNTDSSTQDDAFTIEMLQGYLSQTSPQIYHYSVSNSAPYDLWVNISAQLFSIQLDYTYFNNMKGLVQKYQSIYQGYVLVDLSDNSTNIAIAALAAGNPWLVVTTKNQPLAVSLGLPLKYDLRGKTLSWALQTFNINSYSTTVTVLQEASKYNCMGDFSVSMKALQWWQDDITSSLSQQIWNNLVPPFSMFGWGPDEYNTVNKVSQQGGFTIASDWASNLDIFANYDIPQFTQSSPSPSAKSKVNNVHTVCFLMSDGDNIQWILDSFATNPTWWGSPDRGYVPLGWTLSPSLADVAPVTMAYLYNGTLDTTKPYRNVFVGGVSGVGYFYPDSDPDLTTLNKVTSLTAGYMNKADMNIVTVLSHGEGYSTDAIPQAYLQHDTIQAIFWENFDDYSGMHGNITFINNKPVIGGRFNLWGNGNNPSGPTFKNVTGLINSILTLPRDPTSSNGYTLVPVHAWSHNVTDVRTVMEGLYAAAPNEIEVLPPDEFVQRIIANVVH